MIYTHPNFISIFMQINTWWYIPTATLHQLSCRYTPDDMYIPQLYINFPADEHVIIYRYRNFISTLLQMNTWWDIHTATFYQFSCRWTRDDIYIPQHYFSFPADEHVMIYTYCNFISTFLLWTPDDIYTLQLYINFQQINTVWYIDTPTLYQLSCRWTPFVIYIP